MCDMLYSNHHVTFKFTIYFADYVLMTTIQLLVEQHNFINYQLLPYMVLLPSVGVVLEIFLSTISINSSNTTYMVLLPSVGVVLEIFLSTISINSSNTTVVSISSKHWI